MCFVCVYTCHYLIRFKILSKKNEKQNQNNWYLKGMGEFSGSASSKADTGEAGDEDEGM